MNWDWIENTKYSVEQIAVSYDDADIVERCERLTHHYLCSYAGIFESAAENCDRETPRYIAYRVCGIACDISTHSAEVEVPVRYLDVLSHVLMCVSVPELRAHFYDVLWTYGQKHFPRPIEFARNFLLEVLTLKLDDAGWFGNQYCDFWRRAVELSVLLGNGVKQERAGIFKALKDEYINAVSNEDRLLAWAIPPVFHEYKVYDVINPETLAKNYEKLAERALVKGENCCAQIHYSDAKEWYNIAKLPHECNRMIVGYADACVCESENESAKEQASWARVGAFYDMAISAYMSIPNSDREAFNVDVKLENCKKMSDAAHAKALKQMKTVRGPMIDISDEVKKAEDCVRQKALKDALRILCLLYPFSEGQAEQHAKRLLNVSTIPFLMGKTVLGGDPNGRPVASAPAMSLDSENKEGQSRLSLEKISAAAYLAQSVVSSRLYPAYKVIKSEHKGAVSEFKSLVDEAPLIPYGHKRVYAEALELGFEGRFTMASYVLAPEIENIVRAVLNQAGIVTTSVQNGFQEEKGLSNLVKEKQLAQLFEPDFVFELKAIFCNHAGPNVRNVVAHGLKDDSWFDTLYDFYVWWFALRIVFMHPKTRPE